jgi:hypothetical protein
VAAGSPQQVTSMEPVSGLKPVRDYREMRSAAEALDLMVRVAAESGTDQITQRAEQFRRAAVQRLGPEAFSGDRHKLLQLLQQFMQHWGLNNLQTDMDKITGMVAANPFVLGLSLGRLLNVTPQSSSGKEALYDLLARAIDSIVVRVVLNSSPEDVQKALPKAAEFGGQTGHPEPLGVMEVVNADLPYDSLGPYTFQWISAVVKNWIASSQYLGASDLRGEMEDPSNAPSFVNVPLPHKLKLLQGDDLPLLLFDIKPLMSKMDAGNNVGDVVNAAFESAVFKNGINWWATVGRYINWDSRRDVEEKAVPDTEEDESTKTMPGKRSIP